ncbi:hypothetical protein KI387_027817, partial [Taxus chinensis]
LRSNMASVRFSFASSASMARTGGPMDLQGNRRRGTANFRKSPSFKIIRAVRVSGAESQATPPAIGHMFSQFTSGRSYDLQGKKSMSLYEVLGLSGGASSQDIKAAYRKLARQFHPDTAGSCEEKSISTQMFLQIQSAYSVLSNREDRAQYDRQLVMQQSQRWNRGPYRGHAGRNWETDQC